MAAVSTAPPIAPAPPAGLRAWWQAARSFALTRPIVRVVRAGGNPRRLNMALFLSAQLHMRFGAVLAAGLLAGAVIERR